jgi:1-acyl-sn-glycerol-3-phosphate acyltransferase
VPFLTRRPAEYLERLLFVCPQCHSVATLVSRVGRFWCTRCGYAVRVNDRGFLMRDAGPLYFDDPADWNAWQHSVFHNFLHDGRRAGEHLLQESTAVLLRGYRFRRLRRLCRGSLRLFADRLELSAPAGRRTAFSLSLIRGANVQNGEKLEFYYTGALFRVDFPNPRASSYMWLKGIEMAREDEAASPQRAASL